MPLDPQVTHEAFEPPLLRHSFGLLSLTPGLSRSSRVGHMGIRRTGSRLDHEAIMKPWILLVPGMWGGAHGWDAWQPRLQRAGCATEAITLPGHAGYDESALAGLGLADYAQAVRARVKLAAVPPVLIGHGLGGLVAQLVADDTPLGGARPGQPLCASPDLATASEAGAWLCAPAFPALPVGGELSAAERGASAEPVRTAARLP